MESPYTDCCGRLIRGTGYADTAEDLMRSRFSAFALKEWDYLAATLHPDERAKHGPEEFKKASGHLAWTQLDIVGTKKGGQGDQTGEVEYIAHFVEDGEAKTLHETSKFMKVDGRWVYSQKQSSSHIHAQGHTCGHEPQEPQKPFVRETTKVGRNDPCPCNSGKKFKKCCGK